MWDADIHLTLWETKSRRIKGPLLITLLLVLAIVFAIEKPISLGTWAMIAIFAAFIFTLLRKGG